MFTRSTAVTNDGDRAEGSRRATPEWAGNAEHTTDEATLLALIAAGDDGDALVELYRRYESILYRLGRRLLNDEGMAEEMVQDTFVRVWRSASRFDPSRGSVRTFILVIARGAAADLRRRSASRPLDVMPGHEIEQREGDSASGPDATDGVLLGMVVGDALDALPAKHAEVLRLHFDQDMSQSQIAERLDVPLGTIKTRSFHALRSLRRELQDRGVI